MLRSPLLARALASTIRNGSLRSMGGAVSRVRPNASHLPNHRIRIADFEVTAPHARLTSQTAEDYMLSHSVCELWGFLCIVGLVPLLLARETAFVGSIDI
jgi:hypothetical protein